MKILLLGGGGREHALAWKIAQSEKCEKLFIAPGNAGTQNVGENVDIKADDFEALKNFTVENGVDMVVVGPEDPLVRVFTMTSRTILAPRTSLSSVHQRLVPYWKAARTSPRSS